MRKSPWILIVCILVGGLFGGLLGEVVVAITQPGVIQDIFTQTLKVGLSPPVTIDLWLLTFTVGFTLKMNMLSLMGIFFGIFVYKQI